MQVTINVLRVLACGSTIAFNATGSSVAEAIQVADHLVTGKSDGTAPAADTKTEPTTTGKKSDAKTASSPSGAAPATTGKQESAPGNNAKKTSGAEGNQQNGASQEAGAVSYDDVKKAITAIATKARQLAVDTLARFGVTSGKDLKPEQYADFVVFADKVLAGEVNPAEACTDDIS